ncbi:MAG: DUF4124 domain-containing protein [Gammaproteobacteria bacterium]|nr:DUF4124 domain-containing protein [Gammaproteobacteria bacterium]
MIKIISITCLFLIVSNAQAKLYKCKDQYGRTAYQDKPCVSKNKIPHTVPGNKVDSKKIMKHGDLAESKKIQNNIISK